MELTPPVFLRFRDTVVRVDRGFAGSWYLVEEKEVHMRCQHCGLPLKFLAGRGWVHPAGGTYMMYCPDCGWKGAPYPSPTRCPICGSRNVRDDHCVSPVSD